jgi:hypothetical protein
VTDIEWRELNATVLRLRHLLPSTMTPLIKADAKWADEIETLLLDPLLGKSRLKRFKGHIVADELRYGAKFETAINQLEKQFRKL